MADSQDTMSPKQQEIALRLMAIYEECHRDCEGDRLAAMEEDDKIVLARCAVCDLIAEYYAAGAAEPRESTER